MKATFTLTRNAISPDLAKKIRQSSNPQAALRGAGEVLVQMAKRSFDEPALRPTPWPALKPATVQAKARANKSNGILKSSGTLWRSLRVIGADNKKVTVGSDRPYAGFHQIGTKYLPARPFFPVTAQGQLTPAAKARVEKALQIKLGLNS